ncbi:MAG: glutathione S-transferase N-terminal domain-containing protein [Alphaproteobacteria bacterium]
MSKPIDVHYWPTPNGWKVTILLEELGVPYNIVPVNIGRGEQFKPEFLKIAPNNRMPAIVDHEPTDGGEPLPVFESGAILIYLAEKYGKFLPTEPRPRAEVMQWSMWQMGGLGPMAGQCHHFRNYANDKIEYAINRYTDEVNRLYGVMNARLADRDYLAGDYSIADMLSWPWAILWERQGQDIAEFTNLKAWLDRVGARPAVAKGRAVGEELRANQPAMDEAAKKILFGQRAR